MKKGAMFTMEAFLAAMLVLVTIFFLYSDPMDLPTFQEKEIRRRLRDCMVDLDTTADLRVAVHEEDHEFLHNETGKCLPPGIDHEVVICDWDGCGEFDPPPEKSVVSSNHFIAGKNTDYFPTEIVVYGWAE